MTEKTVPLLVLDLDGTVRQGKDDPLGRFVNGPQDVIVFPEAVVLMRQWKDCGGRIIGASNQGGIALGIITMEQVEAALMETDRQCDGLFDTFMMCPHHPQAKDPAMARCPCRKPSPGMIVQAAAELHQLYGERYPPHLGLMVGDRPEDEQCAALAGLDFMWAKDWRAQATS